MTHMADLSTESGEDEHTDHIRKADGDTYDAAGVSVAAFTDQSASSYNGSTDRCHKNECRK